tara:strand:+ start:58 stop:624 length:567 start_codon:yes stop_codon:yes gene_type:complete
MVKNKLRKSLFEQGQSLSNSFITNSNLIIQSKAIESIDFKSNINNLLYFPYWHEVSIELIKEEINKYSNNIYMPRIISDKNMSFNLLDGSPLVKNKYGINEINNNKYLDPLSFNCMFIPFVGIDSNGQRLGYGGGYFDKSLEILKSAQEKPLIVGLGYDYQVSEEVYGEDHDLKYDLVITERRILSFV